MNINIKRNRKVARPVELTPEDAAKLAKKTFMRSLFLCFLPFAFTGAAAGAWVTSADTSDPWFIITWAQFPAATMAVSLWVAVRLALLYVDWAEKSEYVRARKNRRQPKGLWAWLKTPSALQ